MPKVLFKCAVCDIEFSDYASNRKGKEVFCSAACRSAWVSVHNSITRGGDGIQRTKPEKDLIDYRKHVDKRRARVRARYYENRESILSALKARDKSLKLEIITAYGGKCNCCGETHFEFLTIDHTEGGGAEHRRQKGKGRGIYKDLKARGFPKEGYRLLCLNCNISLGFYGYCPHKPEEHRQIDKRPHANAGRPRIVA